MNKIRNSDFLKILCYILIPILVGILILSIIHIAYLNEWQVEQNETKYSQTNEFAQNYIYYLISKVTECKNAEEREYFIKLEDEEGNIYYYQNNEQYYNSKNTDMQKYINFIIIDKYTNQIYTNIKSNNYNQEKNNIKNEKNYWNYTDSEIETNLKYIDQNNIRYNYNYYNLQDLVMQKYDIYSYYDEEKAINQIGITELKIEEFIIHNKNLPLNTCITTTILLVIIAIYLFWSIGHKKGKEITLGVIDQIPYEIISIVCLIIILIQINFFGIIYNFFGNIITTIGFIICYIIAYIACAIIGITTIKRIKANKFWQSFLTYKIIKYLYNKLKKINKEITIKTKSSKAVVLYYWGYVLISVILGILGIFFRIKFAIPILIIFWIWIYYKIRKYARQEDEIKESLEAIYNGKTDIRINDDELEGILKEMAIYINDISNGFANSIQEKLKSERLKTELITNVSHDIKTPLTSIINYVDLLKKEDIQNEKIKEYIKIIDVKSQRLKKLTEDVVEASKVSSGNIKLKIEEIDIKELINQTIGEFKDKLEEKQLKIECKMPNDEIKIKADSRYMYRIVENLFSNITKYAQESSRVYIDVKNEKGHVEVSIKNISKAKLNISSDELMQRFVRGDKSRYTEGSGLGLSIAKSLTELQNGKFDIIIDGDLFKVNMRWSVSGDGDK